VKESKSCPSSASRAAQLPQNLEVSGLSEWHLGHFIALPPFSAAGRKITPLWNRVKGMGLVLKSRKRTQPTEGARSGQNRWKSIAKKKVRSVRSLVWSVIKRDRAGTVDEQ
jgi:hypothetical protein